MMGYDGNMCELGFVLFYGGDAIVHLITVLGIFGFWGVFVMNHKEYIL